MFKTMRKVVVKHIMYDFSSIIYYSPWHENYEEKFKKLLYLKYRSLLQFMDEVTKPNTIIWW